jgi:uncharacterized phage protein gp47/JayE
MPFTLPTLEDIRDAILADWRNLDNRVTVDADSDNHIRASGFGGAVLGLYQFAAWGVNQFFPDTADAENLVRFAAVRGIIQQPAASAAGTVQFTGVPGAAILLATVIQTTDGQQYQTTAAGAIGVDGKAQLPAAAVTAGTVGNQVDNTPGVLQSAPAGVDVAVTLLQMSGGVETESTASLLARVLDRLRQPPAGGNKYDYPRWAMEVPGVTAAFIYPARRGIGTVDVAILSNGLPPSENLRAAVTAYIGELAEVTADWMVLVPQLVPIDVTATVVLGPDVDLASVRTKVGTGLAAYFASLRPGDTVRRTRIQTILGDIDGVVDYDLAAPAANVVTLVDATHVQMPALGTVTIGL